MYPRSKQPTKLKVCQKKKKKNGELLLTFTNFETRKSAEMQMPRLCRYVETTFAPKRWRRQLCSVVLAPLAADTRDMLSWAFHGQTQIDSELEVHL